MDTQRFLLTALLTFVTGSAGILYGQSDADRAQAGLKLAQEAIDANAVTRYFEPPSRQSETKWQVVKMESCQVELKETWHRESPNSVFIGQEMFGRSEDKTTTYAFDLHELSPNEIMADTSTGVAHVKIFAAGDVFHLKTDTVSRTVRTDGTAAETTNWSVPGNERNMWIYFDSPSVDNKALVRRVAEELQMAASQCITPRASLLKRSPKMIVASALRQLNGNTK